ncbi:MAG: SprT family zinc-dependent metalloprotease [Elusimicrobiota bacterium]|nr:SprT family zinc-dependent metalloprotease [Elusimicrobiota bacterium]
MPSLVHKETIIDYYLAPSKRRRSIIMRVDRDSRVQVRAPRFTAIHYIENFIKERIDWIIKKQNRFEKLDNLHPVKEFKTGEIFPLFDQDLQLHIKGRKQKKALCVLDGSALNLFINDNIDLKFKAEASRAIRGFYSGEIKNKAMEIINKYSKVLDVNVVNLSIGDQKSIWGSCSRKGKIRLNWRLAMMPFDVMEYIVIHELCHLKVHGHGRKFWEVVENILPDYKKRLKWLRQHGISFFLISDWG